MFNYVTPVELYVSGSDNWVTVSRTPSPIQYLSNLLPSNTVGVFLYYYVGEANRDFGFRKPGSTDDRSTYSISSLHQCYATVGVDASNNFEAYFDKQSVQEVWLIGYVTDDDAVFFTNAYNKTPTVFSDWIDVDLSTECPSAIGIIFEYTRSAGYFLGVRKNGSSDARTRAGSGHGYGIIGCDGGQVIECYDLEHLGEATELFIIGYITSGMTFNTNAVDISLTIAGAYTDIDLSAYTSASLVVIELDGGSYKLGLRPDGSSWDEYEHTSEGWAFVGVPASGIIEGKIESTSLDFYLTGYAASGNIFPSDSMTRVTGIIHRYSAGAFTQELMLGDVQTGWEIMKTKIEKKPGVAAPEGPIGPHVPEIEWPEVTGPTALDAARARIKAREEAGTTFQERLEERRRTAKEPYARVVREQSFGEAVVERRREAGIADSELGILGRIKRFFTGG